MTEQSIRRRILLIMAMSGGEIKKEICMELCGSKPYYKKMMQQMKEKGEAETIFGCHPRTLHIKKNNMVISTREKEVSTWQNCIFAMGQWAAQSLPTF